jgi:aspartyl aminopeptidase
VRTTVTLDPDVAALLKRTMAERGVSFKQALNDAVRSGIAGSRPKRRTRFRTATADMGVPLVNLDRALQVAADLEDEEMVRKLRLGK